MERHTCKVTANLNKNDSILTRGTIITSIDNRTAKQLIDTFFNYITGDGYSGTGRYQTLSSYGTFGVLYKNVFGLNDSFKIKYINNNSGREEEMIVPIFTPVKDSLDNSDTLKLEKYTAKERRYSPFIWLHVIYRLTQP